jgi:hypothetical protein
MKTDTTRTSFDFTFRNLCAKIGITLLSLTACSKTGQHGMDPLGTPGGQEVEANNSIAIQGVDCPICLEPIQADGVDAAEGLIEEQCGQPFHRVCMSRWADRMGIPTCPHCRGDLSPALLNTLGIIRPQQQLLLHRAVRDRDMETIHVLIAGGANVNEVDDINRTPLHWAADEGFLEIVQALIAGGANVNVQDNNNKTPLHWAAERGFLEIVQALIAGGANVNEVDGINRTPLHWAADEGFLEIVQALIAGGANVNAQDNNNITPLHWAADQGFLEIVQALIAGGANVNAQDNNNKTPLYWADNQGFIEIAQALIAAGANINAQDNK